MFDQGNYTEAGALIKEHIDYLGYSLKPGGKIIFNAKTIEVRAAVIGKLETINNWSIEWSSMSMSPDPPLLCVRKRALLRL